MVRATAAVILATSACACASQQPLFRDDGYHHDRYSYAVANASPGRLASSDWALENFQVDDGGRPQAPKIGPDYRYQLRADGDGDGTAELAEEMDLVDLRLVHRKTAARMWLSSIPLSQTLAETELAVLAKHFVNAVHGTGLRIERIGESLSGSQQTYATRIIDQKPLEVDGVPALRVSFEMASVDQIKLDSNSRWQRVSAVLMRPGFFWFPNDARSDRQLFPVLLVAGYVSQPEHFDAGMSEFGSFVGRIRFAPAEASAQAGKVLSCAPARDPIRVALVRGDNLRVLSPDLGDSENECVTDALKEVSWEFRMRKSLVFRKRDAQR